jgi:hypothetical protein
MARAETLLAYLYKSQSFDQQQHLPSKVLVSLNGFVRILRNQVS